MRAPQCRWTMNAAASKAKTYRRGSIRRGFRFTSWYLSVIMDERAPPLIVVNVVGRRSGSHIRLLLLPCHCHTASPPSLRWQRHKPDPARGHRFYRPITPPGNHGRSLPVKVKAKVTPTAMPLLPLEYHIPPTQQTSNPSSDLPLITHPAQHPHTHPHQPAH
jgi:hypothetical protein